MADAVKRGVIGGVRDAIDFLLWSSGLIVLYRTGRTPGDLVCMTGTVSMLRRSLGARVIVVSRVPVLFRHHPDVLINIPLNALPGPAARLLLALMHTVRGGRVQSYGVEPPQGLTIEQHIRENLPPVHLMRLHAMHFPFSLSEGPARATIVFGEAEERGFARALRALGLEAGSYALVHSEGKTSYTPNKEWGGGRMAAVVAALPRIRFVQVGLASDALIPGCLDLRGKTPDLRHLAYLIRQARFLLCLEGLYNHLAGAFHTPSLVVFSGFHHAGVATYPNTVPLTNPVMPPCAPCWLCVPCPVPGKPCMSDLTPAHVVAEIARRFPPPEGRGA